MGHACVLPTVYVRSSLLNVVAPGRAAAVIGFPLRYFVRT